jgi:hypothetical protein
LISAEIITAAQIFSRQQTSFPGDIYISTAKYLDAV